MAITHPDTLKKYATRNTICRTRKGFKSVEYNCYELSNIKSIYNYFKEMYAIKYIINDIVDLIEHQELLTVEKVKEIYEKYKQDIRYRKRNIDKILTHLETMQEQSETKSTEEAPSEAQAELTSEEPTKPPGGGRKRRSRKHRSRKLEIKRRGRKSRKH